MGSPLRRALLASELALLLASGCGRVGFDREVRDGEVADVGVDGRVDGGVRDVGVEVGAVDTGVEDASGDDGSGADAGDGSTACAHVVSGPSSAGAGRNDGSTGAGAWTNWDGIAAEDAASVPPFGSVAAEAILSLVTTPTNYLVAKDFGFALPDDAVVLGIEVDARVALTAFDLVAGFARVRLVRSGTIQVVDRAAGRTWPSGFVYETFGGPDDRWGGEWLASDINDIDFGVAISAEWFGSAGNDRAYVDHVRITVYYMSCVSSG